MKHIRFYDDDDDDAKDIYLPMTQKKEGWVVGCVKFLEGVDLRAKTIKGYGVKWE